MKPTPVHQKATAAHVTGENFQYLTEQPLLAIYAIQNNVFTYVNHKFTEIFGFPQNELLGVKNLVDLVIEHDHAKVIEYFSNTEKGIAQDFHLFFQGRKSNADLIELEAHCALMECNGKPSLIGSLVDITKRKKAAELLQQTLKMEAISMLARGVAHDFNNLLTIINGYSTILFRSLEQESPLRKIALNILNAGERAVEMTKQLHSLSHRQNLDPKLIHMDNMIKSFEPLLSRIIGEKMQLVTNFRGHDSFIEMDFTQFEEIVTDLIVNARDASTADSRIIIETANHALDEAFFLANPDLVPGDYVMLSVTDFGIALEDDDKKRIFEPFFKSRTKKRVTGLGLAVVYAIAKQNNGTIDVISQPKQGSTFRLFLPKAQ